MLFLNTTNILHVGVVGSLMSLLSLVWLNITYASIFMLTLLTLFLMLLFHHSRQPRVWSLIGLIGFLIGYVSDYLMQVFVRFYQRHKRNPRDNSRSGNMIKYFDRVGSTRSSVFAGLLTAWMTMNTFVIDGLTTTDTNPKNMLSVINLKNIILIGFGVGALWGVVVESLNAKAAAELMVFYKNTPGGYIENRVWDGLTIALSAGITVAVINIV